MTYAPHIERTDAYSLARLPAESSEVVVANLSIDIHEEKTIADQATGLMYPDAILSGAGEQSRAEFLNAVNLLGASIDVDTSQDIVHLSLKARAAQFPKLLKLVALMLESPTFSESELKRVRSTVVNELHESQEDSKAIAHDRLKNQLYAPGDRRRTYDLEEMVAEVQSTKPRHLRAYHERVMNRHWTASIAGPETAITAFAKYLKRLKKVSSEAAQAPVHEQHKPRPGLVSKHIPSRQNIDFSIGAPIPFTLHHPDYVPLAFAIAVLGKWGGFTGRLMSTVREQEGLTYAIYAKPEGFSGTEQGYWRIMTFFHPEKAVQGLTSTIREIKKLHTDGISEDELGRFQRILSTKQALINDSLLAQLYDLHTYHFLGFTIEEMQEHKARIQSLTVEEVNRVIQTYLDPKTLTISAAGPTSRVQKELESFAKTVA